ncbi:unnamed protein product [marine sediment metagenome]|uniref:PH domain-containing protein n=1 Tax=marine sediment metagenome TaxID=412755 RepID=X0ZMD1_9ZZZZ
MPEQDILEGVNINDLEKMMKVVYPGEDSEEWFEELKQMVELYKGLEHFFHSSKDVEG